MLTSAESGGDAKHHHSLSGRMKKESRKQVILLVDDESLMQELAKDLLEEHGFDVIVAGDGMEAIDIFRRRRDEIDLVILDLLMPKLDGGQTYLEMKKIKTDVKAFFCTAYTPHEVIGSLLKEQSLRALQKPFQPAELVQLVQEMLRAN